MSIISRFSVPAWRFAAVALLGGFFSSLASATPQAVEARLPEVLIPSLRGLLEKAERSSEASRVQELRLREAEGRQIAAGSVVRPRFRTGFALRQEESQEGSGFEDQVVYNVTLTQPLYHWGALRKSKEIGELQYDLESIRSSNTRSSVRREVSLAYVALVVARQRVDRSEQDLQMVREALETRRAEVLAGTVSESSLDDLRLELQRRELDALRQRNDYENRFEGLLRDLSLPAASLEAALVVQVPEVDLLSPAHLERLREPLSQAARRHPSLAAQDLEIEIAQRRLAIEQQGLKPRVDAQVGLTSNEVDQSGLRREQDFAFFGVNVAWNIFDGRRTKGKILEAASRLEILQGRREAALARLEAETEGLMRRLAIEGRSLEIEEAVLAQREKALESVEASFREGRAAQAEIERLTRERDYALLQAQVARAAYMAVIVEVHERLQQGLDSGTAGGL